MSAHALTFESVAEFSHDRRRRARLLWFLLGGLGFVILCFLALALLHPSAASATGLTVTCNDVQKSVTISGDATGTPTPTVEISQSLGTPFEDVEGASISSYSGCSSAPYTTTTYDTTGVTSGTVTFETDGSESTVFDGSGASSVLQVDGSGDTLAISADGSGIFGSTSYSAIDGTITAGSGASEVDLTASGTLRVAGGDVSYLGQALSGFTTYTASGNSVATTFETDNSNATPYTFTGSTGTGSTNTLQLDSTTGLTSPVLTLTGTGGGTYTQTSGSLPTITTFSNITSLTNGGDAVTTVHLKNGGAFTIGSSTTYDTTTIAAAYTTFVAGSGTTTVTLSDSTGTLKVNTSTGVTYAGDALQGFVDYTASGNSVATTFETDNSNATPYTFTGSTGTGSTNTLQLDSTTGLTSPVLTLTGTGGGTYTQTSGSLPTITTFSNITSLTNGGDAVTTVHLKNGGAFTIGSSTTYDTTTIAAAYTTFVAGSGTTTVTLSDSTGTLKVNTSTGVTYAGDALQGFVDYTASGNSVATTFETDNSNATPYTFTGSTGTGSTNTLQLDSTTGLTSPVLTLTGTNAGNYSDGGSPTTPTTFTHINTVKNNGDALVTVTLTDPTGTLKVNTSTGVTYAGMTLTGYSSFTASGNSVATTFETDNSNATPYTFTGSTGTGSTNTLQLDSTTGLTSPVLTLTGTNAGNYSDGGSPTTPTTFTHINTVKNNGDALVTVTLTDSTGTLKVNTSTGVTYAGMTLTGYSSFTASGNSVATTFETDNSNATPYTFTGSPTGTNNLTLDAHGTTGSVLTLNNAGDGTYANGGTITTFYTVNGTITGTADATDLSSTIEIGGTSGTLATASGSATYTQGSVTTTLVGFTTFAANAGVATTFRSDGGTVGGSSVVFIGNDSGATTNSHLVLTASGTLIFAGSGAGSFGSMTYSQIKGPLAETAGASVSIGLPTSGSATLTVSGGDATLTIGSAVQDLGTSITSFTAQDGSTSFVTDGSPGYTFIGYASGGDTISFANVAAGAGMTFCLANGSSWKAYFGSSDACSGSSFDTISNITTITGTPNADDFVMSAGNWTLDGGGGTNTVDFSSTTSSLTVDLGSDTVSGGFGGTIQLSNFESVIGSATAANTLYNNPNAPGVLVGGSANDTFNINGGTVVINGGAGSNTITFIRASGAVTLDLNATGFQNTGAGTVLIIPGTIQNVIGSTSGSTIVGGSGSGTIQGMSSSGSSDWLDAGAGTYTLDGSSSAGTETLIAGSGTVTLKGGGGSATFFPGAGLLTITPGSGANILSFAGAPSGVDVNLSASNYTVTLPGSAYDGTEINADTATGGWGTSAITLSGNITSAIGDALGGVIVGGSNSTIDGGTGSSLLIAAPSATGVTLKSEGTATIVTGTGNQTVICSSGSDCTVDYAQAAEDTSNDGFTGDGVSVTLGSGTSAGLATKYGSSSTTDVLYGVSEVIGSSFNDTLTAGGAGQTLVGGTGQANLVTSAAGDDTLIGNGYDNTFTASQGTNNTLIGGKSGRNFFLAQIYGTSSYTPAYDTIVGGGLNDYLAGDASDSISGLSPNATEEFIVGVSNGQPIEETVGGS